MKIIYRTGDITQAPENFLVQGTNSHGVQGSGLAKILRAVYPKQYEVYREHYERQGLKLGETIWVDCGRHTIINAVTQKDYGNDKNVVYVSYDAIRDAVSEINRVMKGRAKEEAVAFPLIGAGLANGSWSKIAGIIEEGSTHFQPVVYLLDGVIPNG